VNKFIVITSIFEPSIAIRKFAEQTDWKVIVVGDKKTPLNWQWESVEFLSVSDQKKLGFRLLDDLPYNHYSRKMIGYLYAMQKGADYIADLDDDNIPLANWGKIPERSEQDTVYGSGFFNVYKKFTDAYIWPRGFPLDQVRSNAKFDTRKATARVGIWQFLTNGDPDVDAIFRLLLLDEMITFSNRSPLILDKGVFCPFNSQNTLFTKDAFPLLYLPAFVTFRYTDILRGIVAQPILWTNDLHLSFGQASTIHDRNQHNYMMDFESEIPVYLSAKQAAYISLETSQTGTSMMNNLIAVYDQLAITHIVPAQELALLKAWGKDIENIIGESDFK
jgi:hypothetical protein